MRAAWYESQGSAREVLTIGWMEEPLPGPGEVRIELRCSGINPGDVKKRSNAFGVGMSYPRVIPHSDGAGIVDLVGEGVSGDFVGQRVWCFGAQSYRPFGTAAEYVVVPAEDVRPLPAGTTWEQGACLGIPGITAHRAVLAGGAVRDRTVLVQGGAGAVGMAASGIANKAGARVLATVRQPDQNGIARTAGAHEVVCTAGLSEGQIVERIGAVAPVGVDHIVEVAFGANVRMDEQVLKQGGSIATYATDSAEPVVPFWNLVFKNARVFFLGSDDFPDEEKRLAADALTEMLAGGWPGYVIAREFPLEDVAAAHEMVERGVAGRVVLKIKP